MTLSTYATILPNMDRICIAIWSLNKQKPPTRVTVNLNTSSTVTANSNTNKVKQKLPYCKDFGNMTFPSLFPDSHPQSVWCSPRPTTIRRRPPRTANSSQTLRPTRDRHAEKLLSANQQSMSRLFLLQEFQLQPMVHKAKAGEAPPSSVKTTSDTADSSMTSSIASTSPQLQHSSPVGNGNAKGDFSADILRKGCLHG